MPQRTAGFVTGATPPGRDTATSGDVCGCQGVSWHRVGGSQGCHSAPHGARGGRAGGAPGARDRVLGCRKLRPLAMVSVGALHPKTNLKIVSKHVPLWLNLPEVPAPAVGLGPGLRIFGAPPPSAALHPDGARSGGAGGGRTASGTGVVRPRVATVVPEPASALRRALCRFRGRSLFTPHPLVHREKGARG